MNAAAVVDFFARARATLTLDVPAGLTTGPSFRRTATTTSIR
jgi:hypothetical protein